MAVVELRIAWILGVSKYRLDFEFDCTKAPNLLFDSLEFEDLIHHEQRNKLLSTRDFARS